MRMQVILDSSSARTGSAPIWGGKKGEFRDWTNQLRRSTSPKIYLSSAPLQLLGRKRRSEAKGLVIRELVNL